MEAARLAELHLACTESRIDADLDRGRHAELVAELDALVARHPLREGLRARQLLALYRSGRQSEALSSYQAFRTQLADELGLEPSAALKEIERQILRHDSGLDLDAPAPAPQSSGPEVRYVASGDLSIAYQVVGTGPVDLVFVQGWVCSFQPGWERPQIASFYNGLASIGRLILFDKRGTGLSDRMSGTAALEERMDDVRAVMDAAGSERAILVGVSEGGPMVTLFAATYPERTAGIVLLGSFARRKWAPDYPIGLRPEDAWWRDSSPQAWGLPMAKRFVDERAPSASRRRGHLPLVRLVSHARSEPGSGRPALPDEQGDRRAARPAVHPRADSRALPARRVPPRPHPVHGRADPRRAHRRPRRSRPPAVGGGPARRPRRRSSSSSHSSTRSPSPTACSRPCSWSRPTAPRRHAT